MKIKSYIIRTNDGSKVLKSCTSGWRYKESPWLDESTVDKFTYMNSIYFAPTAQAAKGVLTRRELTDQAHVEEFVVEF